MFRHRPAFTIIELLVVVSIIALLIGILLPAISKALDQAQQTISQTNLRNLGTAMANYAAAYNDSQVSYVNYAISSYGSSGGEAFPAYRSANYSNITRTGAHPNMIAGWARSGGSGWHLYRYVLDGTFAGHHSWAGNPIVFEQIFPGFGQWRLPNLKALNTYVGGKWYDPVFYAPKDTIPMTYAEPAFESPDEVVPADVTHGTHAWSSYCFSPAAMYSPDVMRNTDRGGWQDPWSLNGGFRTPAMSQALYPTLKTHMIEHHWLQNRRAECNPGFTSGTYDGCEPYFYNHGWESEPMCVFFDGHVGGIGVREAEEADGRHAKQEGYGLWSRDTSLGEDGYFVDVSYDMANTSFHALTTDGIRGRDTLSGL